MRVQGLLCDVSVLFLHPLSIAFCSEVIEWYQDKVSDPEFCQLARYDEARKLMDRSMLDEADSRTWKTLMEESRNTGHARSCREAAAECIRR